MYRALGTVQPGRTRQKQARVVESDPLLANQPMVPMPWSLNRYLYQTLHPEIYHGYEASAPFFEGWYFKLVDSTRENLWAIIPGIYRDRDPALDHAFVMTLNGRGHEVTFHRYPVSAFAAARDTFHIRIGPNLFATDFLTLNLPGCHGHLTFSELTPWPVSWRAPGIMGWYGWFPMECYHGIVSLDHMISGSLHHNNQAVRFDGGRGYIEKDWGRNFPQTWIWLQANLFAAPGVALTASIARIPFYGRVFPGFIIGLALNGRLYRFTTYLGATLQRVSVTGKRVQIAVHNREHRLTIEAEQGETALLPAPTPGRGMVPRVAEAVAATLRLRLSDRHGSTLFTGESCCAGMEVVGDTRILQIEG